MKNSIKMAMVGFLLFVSLVGCTKLNQDNYNKIKVGMDYPQVIQIIGKPDKCDAALGTKGCIWGNDQKNITIQFIADKVVFSSMKGL